MKVEIIKLNAGEFKKCGSSRKSVGCFLSPPLKKGDEGGFFNYNLFHISSMTYSRFVNTFLSENLITVIPTPVK